MAWKIRVSQCNFRKEKEKFEKNTKDRYREEYEEGELR